MTFTPSTPPFTGFGGTPSSVGTLMMGTVVPTAVVSGGSAVVLAESTWAPQAGSVELPHDFTLTAQRPALGGHAVVPTVQLDPFTGVALAGLLSGVVVWRKVHRAGEDSCA